MCYSKTDRTGTARRSPASGREMNAMQEYTYSPHLDFYIDEKIREPDFEMGSFHIHHKYELYYQVAGSRRYFIEDAAYVVNAGNLVLIGENQIHKTGPLGDGPTTRVVCNFSQVYLKEISEAFPQLDFFSFLDDGQTHLLTTLSVKQQNQVYTMLKKMLSIQGDSPRSQAARKLQLATLLLQMQDLCEAQRMLGGESGRITNRIVNQVQGYVTEHYSEKLTLTGIAGRFYISPYYLSRLFKKTINLSLIEYINGVRIKAAQQLIETTTKSIASVAEETGFTTSAHFRRVFKEATGFSPQQYRQYIRHLNK